MECLGSGANRLAETIDHSGGGIGVGGLMTEQNELGAVTPRDDEPSPRNYLGAAVKQLVPAAVAERGIELSVATDAPSYAPGEPIEITVTIRNRLPAPVVIATADRRVWSWSVDGLDEGSDENRYIESVPNSIEFGPRERRQFVERWDGRIRRTGAIDRWQPLARTEHRITAWLRTNATGRVVDDETEFTVE